MWRRKEREREEREEKGVAFGFSLFFETVLYFYLSTIKIRADNKREREERDVRAGGGGPEDAVSTRTRRGETTPFCILFFASR